MKNKRIFYSMNKSNALKIFIISFFLAIASGHYSELYQMNFFIKIRNLIYFGQTEAFIRSDEGLLTRYAGTSDEIVNPVHNAQLVLEGAENYLIEKYYPEYISYAYGKEKIDTLKLIEIVDWFIAYYKEENISSSIIIRLPYEMDLPVYKLNSPWYSGMAQGHVLIIALAAYELTGNIKYFQFAEKVARVLDITTERGGVKLVLPTGSWFEEYASSKLSIEESPKVLNGHIFAIDGLFWYWKFNEYSQHNYELLKSSISVLNQEIFRFKSYFWSYYDLNSPKHNYADIYYHDVHVQQLKRVNEFYAKVLQIETDNIGKYSSVFSFLKLLPFGYIERLIYQHNRMILLITFSNFIFFIVTIFGFYRLKNRSK